jgi:hypothetical protein
MSQISVLAGIIQGEASQHADQFGVASTILNRTQGVSGYVGPGFGLTPFQAANLSFFIFPPFRPPHTHIFALVGVVILSFGSIVRYTVNRLNRTSLARPHSRRP